MRVVIFSILLCSVSLCLGQEAGVRYPSVALVGASIDGMVMSFEGQSDGIQPKRVTLETSNGIVTGLVVEFPTEVSLEMVRASINQTWKDSEREIRIKDVYGWRNEEKRFALQLGRLDSITRLVMRRIGK